MNKYFLISAFMIICFGCNVSKHHSVSNINCVRLYTNDESSDIFDKILVKNLDSKLERFIIEIDTTKNPYDDSDTWICKKVKCENSNLTYYSTSNGNTIVTRFSIYSNKLNVISDVYIGMKKELFFSIFFNKYANIQNYKTINCIHLSDLSEFCHLYFWFKQDKLVLIEYYNNAI